MIKKYMSVKSLTKKARNVKINLMIEFYSGYKSDKQSKNINNKYTELK